MASIDNAGLNVDTQDQVEASYRASFVQEFGARFDVSALSLTGRSIPIISSTVVQLQQLLSEVLSVINPNNAQGRILDFAASLFDEQRAGPTRASIPARLFGLPGFDASDRRCRYVRNSTIWRTPSGSVIGATGFVDVVLVADTAGTLLPDGTAIRAFADGTDQWVIVDTNVSFTAVESTADSTDGTDTQEAPALRELIRLAGRSSGVSTEDGIRRTISRVAGPDVSIDNNRKLAPNANGVPGKATEVVFDQGAIGDVAQAAYDSFSDTNEFFGTTPVTAYRRNDDGSLNLDDPVEVPVTPADRIEVVWDVTIDTTGAEAALPDNATTLVENALANYTNLSLKIGLDVLPLEGGAAVVSALPVGSVPNGGLLVNVGYKGGAPPGGAALPITSRQRATTNAAAQAARIVGTLSQPFSVVAGQNLDLAVNGGVPQSVVFALSDFAVISAATALELATAINTRTNGISSGSQNGALTLASSTTGAGASIAVLASSDAGLLAVLGLSVASQSGSDGDITVTIT